ncbi:hypothetical protein DL98DRAFT_580851 [Cadophora sp. DSE1049]|nr:hypothetical protein DL98DRAFT_580851 [Cadophora sp. DSE1049]
MAPTRNSRPLEEIWIPLRLRTLSWCDNPQTPHPRLRRRLRFTNILRNYGLFGCLVMLIALNFSWDEIDKRLCPVQVSCKAPCKVLADGDIAGIGVRCSIYIQTFCTLLLLAFSTQAATVQAARESLIMLSFGIVATGAIFSVQGKLSLAHSMVIVSLLTQSLIPTWLIEPWSVRTPGLFITQIVRGAVYSALSFWLVIKTPCIGSDRQCNLCTSSFVGFVKVPAIAPLRRSWILAFLAARNILSLDTMITYYGPGHYLRALVAVFSERERYRWAQYAEETHLDIQGWRQGYFPKKANPTLGRFINGCLYWLQHDQTLQDAFQEWPLPISSGLQERTTNIFHAIWKAIQVPRIHRFIIGAGFAIIWTYDTEQVVKDNLDTNANEWGYGQISAMILSAPSVVAVMQMFIDAWNEDRCVDWIDRT